MRHFNVLFLALLALDAICAATVIEPPKSFTPKKKPPKTIQVEILKPAENCVDRVQKGDQVEISFHLFLFSSEKEVDCTEPDEGYSFRVGYGESIEGLDQGIIGMCLNETRRMIIPSYLAYGTRGATVIVPPGASIILDVTLLDHTPMEFDERRLERVEQTKLVYDKRQKDSHYMGHGADKYWYPKYERAKPRDEEEEEEKKKKEKELKVLEEKEKIQKEEEAAIEKEVQKLISEKKNKGEKVDAQIESDLRKKIALKKKKDKKAITKGFRSEEQVRQEIEARRKEEEAILEEERAREAERAHKTPTGRRFRGLPRPSRLKALMHSPPPKSQENREKYKKDYQQKTRNLKEKREIGRERKKRWIEEHFKPQLTEEQQKQLEEEQRMKEEEEARKKKVESVKDAILKGGKKKTEKEKYLKNDAPKDDAKKEL
ncbi:putative FK506-binding protein 2B [Monocercomonoides exilis]|uniref:putative FK506-binding protein 2B n=1 Tax=Monocercomonoides exilis TaxID=2049356 RepID=UPI003559F66F|nr:putative FK506-binding protein 2B [Monocercomonoides exilis]|eukprot:MONOS_4992.1-p1 / transcript=MONOS_4992.1 / gene=MONOS_4992 / organism=Monocercomonoides_exilis_PA203 / gene_product=RecName / transcript_product=RecName / location=Mono_scaffold00140:35841-37397(+) / protein_length=430 / sequence_SO=supercontig / SO=protein_coding / is_pseudo=false